MPGESFTVSMADFIANCQRVADAYPKFAELMTEQIKWGRRYSPFTPVTLTPDNTGQIIPSVALGSVSANNQTGEAVFRRQGEEDINIAALSALAAEYEITDPGTMRTMLDYCAQGGLDLVRQKLEEFGLGESAKNLRAARENLRRPG